MVKKNILQQKMDSSAKVICLICGVLPGEAVGTDEPQPFYAYVSVIPSKAADFAKQMQSGAVHFADYIEAVLEAGPGVTPPEDVKERMASQLTVDLSTQLKPEQLYQTLQAKMAQLH